MRAVYSKFADDSQQRKYRRKLSVRSKIKGTAGRPRLCVVRSSKNIQVQVIDDNLGATILAVSTFDKDVSMRGKNKEVAANLGVLIGKRLRGLGIDSIVFDRNGRRYHGVLESLAGKVREAGIDF